MVAVAVITNRKKRGIKDEWQLFDSGEFEEVGDDTRNVYTC